MSKIKFLYYDDPVAAKEGTQEDSLKSVVARLQTSTLEVEPFFVQSWELQKNDIITKIKESASGLILDWKLNENVNSNTKEKANYNAEGLAQQLRAMMTSGESEIGNFPIILCSANADFVKTYEKDDSSHDLFDAVFEKKDLDKKAANQLVNISKTYNFLRKNHSVTQILGLEKRNLLAYDIDVRLIVAIEERQKKVVHELSKFLLKEVVQPIGVLIDEKVLAARLGIDMKKSSDWQKLLELLKTENVDYSGVFSDSWKRWWAYKLESWWKSTFEESEHLKYTTATKRVSQLIEKTGLQNLIPATKLPLCHSEEFWTVCIGYDQPIAIEDTFRTKNEPRYVWQDEEYISMSAALEREKGIDIKFINILDKKRFQEAKKELS
jgi:hypothetical protein